MRRVLLLNVTYEPLTTVGLRRAVCLVLGEKAEIVHHDTGGKLAQGRACGRREAAPSEECRGANAHTAITPPASNRPDLSAMLAS